ncbi:MAG: GTP cyclohydrolase II RibA, partial [Polyangiaceae bacterium]
MHVPQRVIRPQSSRTKWLTQATIPTRHGEFETHVFQSGPPDPGGSFASEAPALAADADPGPERLPREHVALVFGGAVALRAREDVLVRVHSECMTSEVFGSLKCDCKEQLDAAMAAIARARAGAVLYLRQEGRGIGLTNKIRAYALQSHGHDTVDANRMLGLPDDARSYEVARDMLSYFGIGSVRLL